MGYFFRHPHTVNEAKQYYASIINEMSILIRVRGRRRAKTLPDTWDERYRSNATIYNWKIYRKTQWKI